MRYSESRGSDSNSSRIQNRPMIETETLPLNLLFERDETAWLEAMADLAAQGRLAEMDHRHLAEYLTDMAKRDRREVLSRLIVLLTHLLKWQHQPERRTTSWKTTIREQRRELRQLLESGVLRTHAENVLADAFAEACEQADETLLPIGTFATAWTLDDALDAELR